MLAELLTWRWCIMWMTITIVILNLVYHSSLRRQGLINECFWLDPLVSSSNLATHSVQLALSLFRLIMAIHNQCNCLWMALCFALSCRVPGRAKPARSKSRVQQSFRREFERSTAILAACLVKRSYTCDIVLKQLQSVVALMRHGGGRAYISV